MKNVKLLLFVISLSLFSCAGVKSGQYVRIDSENSIDTIAKTFKVSKEAILSVNEGKPMDNGAWIFVPTDHGIIEQSRKIASQGPTAKDPRQFFSDYGFLWPVPSSTNISSNFGWRWGRPHQGMDIAARVGSNIVSAQDGVVVYSGDEIGGYGKITVIAHKGGYFTVYAHADKLFTREGQRVYKGQVIATVGMTGRTYGPHLHFEVRKNGEAIDPEKYLAFGN